MISETGSRFRAHGFYLDLSKKTGNKIFGDQTESGESGE